MPCICIQLYVQARCLGDANILWDSPFEAAADDDFDRSNFAIPVPTASDRSGASGSNSQSASSSSAGAGSAKQLAEGGASHGLGLLDHGSESTSNSFGGSRLANAPGDEDTDLAEGAASRYYAPGSLHGHSNEAGDSQGLLDSSIVPGSVARVAAS